MSAEILLSWLATYALHSTLLIAAAWLVTRRGPLAGSMPRDALWKVATTGALLTTTLQVAAPFGGAGIELSVPGAAVVPPEPMRSSTYRNLAAGQTTVARLVPLSTPSGEPDGPVPSGALRPAFRAQREAGATSGSRAAEPLPGGPRTVLVIWLALGGTLLLRHAVRRRRFARRLGRRREVIVGPAREVLDELLQKVGPGRRVRLTATDALASPVALRGNEICVPDRALGQLDRRTLRALLAHELAHIERRDPLWIEIAAMLESVLFFQPLHRLGRRELRSAAEEECDAWAARLTGERHALARCLVEVAGWMRSARMAEAAGMAEPGKGLERRVERLIGPTPDAARGSWRAGALTALGLVAAIACGGPAVRPETDPAPIEPDADVRPRQASPPAVQAARPAAPSVEAPEALSEAEAAAPPDTLERSGRVRTYVFGEDDGDLLFAFDWSPGAWSAWSEEMERLGETLERSLEPLEDFEFQFDSDFLKDFDFYIDAPEISWDSDTLHLRALGAPDGAWAGLVPGDGLRVRIEGEVEWGEATVASISPGGRVEIRDRRGAPERHLIVEPGPEGELLFDYELDGSPHGFDAEGREWLAAVIERVRKAEKSGDGFQIGAAPRAWAHALRGEELAERAAGLAEQAARHAQRRAELEELWAGHRADALREQLRALEEEMARLRQEIERLESDRSDS